MSDFHVGDMVEWTSQSSGTRKKKIGTICAVIPAEKRPDPYVGRSVVALPGGGFGMPRDHKSYLVLVGNKLYWPRVKYLRMVNG